jgi:protein-tyrosine phosphatase
MHLDWEGCFNARLLPVKHGPLVRADALDALTERGWRALSEFGISTIIDLRNEDEVSHLPALPAGVTRLHLPLDGREDRQFWAAWEGTWAFGTPLYYLPHLTRFPERTNRVLQALVDSSGGVVFHCGIGRDRTGMIAMIVQWLLGIGRQAIVEDYLQSAQRLKPLFACRSQEDHGPQVDAYLRSRGTTLFEVCVQFLDGLKTFDKANFEFYGKALRARFQGSAPI